MAEPAIREGRKSESKCVGDYRTKQTDVDSSVPLGAVLSHSTSAHPGDHRAQLQLRGTRVEPL
jgi:hypothetical protein